MNRKGRPFLKKRYVLTRIRDILTRPFYWLYEKRLDSHIHEWQLPRHIALILDGNRRWARSVGLKELTKGHEVGAEKVREVLTWCYGLGIPTVSIWVFSTDNAKRDPQEVQRLMQLFEEKAREWIDDPMIHANEVRIRFMGRLQMLPENVRQAIRDVEAATAQYSRFQLNVAMAYGGREEITDAFRKFFTRKCLQEKQDLREVLENLSPDDIQDDLYVADVPDPDLIIRTSGEIRLSGFLLWQSAYSEFYFCDIFWPAFRRIDLLRAIRAYSRRQRRFGR